MADVPLMNNPMTTAEDIIVGGVSGAPARLAKGSNGHVLTVTAGAVGWAAAAGGGITSAASFPGSPADNDLCYRTDRDILYFYQSSGTRWLSVHEETEAPGWFDTAAPLSGTNTLARWPIRQDYSLYLVRWNVVTFQTNGTPASNNMTVVLSRLDAANAANTVASFVNNGDTASNWVSHDQAINAPLTAGTISLRAVATEAGTVTNFICAESITYRLIG